MDRSFFRTTYDNAVVPALLVEARKGTVHEMNSQARRLLGPTRSNIGVWELLEQAPRDLGQPARGEFRRGKQRLGLHILPMSPQYSVLELPPLDEAEERERFLFALEGSNLGIWDYHLPSRQVTFNQRWARVLGYGPGELNSDIDQWLALIHPRDLEIASQASNAHYRGETEIYEATYRMRHKDGSWRWVLDRGKVCARDEKGQALRMVGTHQDVTEQHEQHLERQQEQEMFHHGPVVMFLWRNEPGWPVEYVSPNIEELFGYSAASLMNGERPFADLVHPDDLERMRVDTESATTGDHSDCEQSYRLLTTDGEVRHVFEYTHILRDDNGKATHFRGYVLDETSHHRAEAEARQLQTRMLEAQKQESLSVLAGGVAHDFNNLLVGVLGNLSLMREDLPRSHAVQELIDEAERAATRATRLSNQMLAYSGKSGISVREVDLNALVRDARPLLASLARGRASLTVQLTEPLPPIQGDNTQLSQVLVNLVTNAAEACTHGQGEISIRTMSTEMSALDLAACVLTDAPPPGRYVVLEVEDNGEGMSRDTQSRVFEPFFTTKFTGRGLGMASVLGIVRAHAGTLHLHSTLGKGSAFRTYFPLAEGEDLEEDSLTVELTETSHRSVLVVDDEALIRNLAGRVLRRAGYATVMAVDGIEALDKIELYGETLFLVILDITMPGVDGFEVLRQIKLHHPELPVILSSGFSRDQSISGLEDPPAAFLQKPYTPQDLMELVDQLLES